RDVDFLVRLVGMTEPYPADGCLASARRLTRIIVDDDVRRGAVFGLPPRDHTPGNGDAGGRPHGASFIEGFLHEMRRHASDHVDIDRHRRHLVLSWTCVRIEAWLRKGHGEGG